MAALTILFMYRSLVYKYSEEKIFYRNLTESVIYGGNLITAIELFCCGRKVVPCISVNRSIQNRLMS